MFFITGVRGGKKAYPLGGAVICNACRAYGRYTMVMSYSEFTFFFIPVFKFGKKYYIYANCCESVYEIDSALGRRIAKGEEIQIRKEDLREIPGHNYHFYRCGQCSYMSREAFDYCPKCGRQA